MRREFAALYRRHVRVFEVQSQEESRLIEPCRDPRDNKFLALSIVAPADLIVSSDDDLLSMSPYQGILIVKPADFVSAYACHAGFLRQSDRSLFQTMGFGLNRWVMARWVAIKL